MKINRKNYELYFVDYLDNNLSRGDLIEFMAFLAQNPDLEEELNLVKDIKLEPETILFKAKNSLIKKNEEIEISKEKFEELCIGKIENTLNKEEEIQLDTHIKLHPELEKELKLFKLTILKPDLSIKFANKESIKRIELTTEKVNQLCIDHIENNLSVSEEKQFNTLLNQNQELKREFELFNLTVLKPDTSIVFLNKSSLKRRFVYPFNKSFLKISSIAVAAVIFVLIITQIVDFSNNNDKKNYANLKQIKKNFKIKNIVPINNETENKLFALTKQNKKNNLIKKKNVFVNKDTTSAIANVNKPNILDSIAVKNNIINLPQEKINNDVAIINENKHNKYLDTTLNAVFENSKYSHFRDMINNVPYESITASSNGNFAMWDIIKAGTNGINYITGSQISVDNKTDEKKRVKRFSLKIGKIGFSRITHK